MNRTDYAVALLTKVTRLLAVDQALAKDAPFRLDMRRDVLDAARTMLEAAMFLCAPLSSFDDEPIHVRERVRASWVSLDLMAQRAAQTLEQALRDRALGRSPS